MLHIERVFSFIVALGWSKDVLEGTKNTVHCRIAVDKSKGERGSITSVADRITFYSS